MNNTTTRNLTPAQRKVIAMTIAHYYPSTLIAPNPVAAVEGLLLTLMPTATLPSTNDIANIIAIADAIRFNLDRDRGAMLARCHTILCD